MKRLHKSSFEAVDVGCMEFDKSLPFPMATFSFKKEVGKYRSYDLDEICCRVGEFDTVKHISWQDVNLGHQIEWLVFPEGIGRRMELSNIRVKTEFEVHYRWNHLTLFKDRKVPFCSIAHQGSRNVWVNTEIHTDLKGANHIMSQMLPGAVHFMWIMRPGGPFPVKSFKDIGPDETGGIKFRIQDFEYIFFVLQGGAIDCNGLVLPDNPGIAVMRYRQDELEAYYYITENKVKIW